MWFVLLTIALAVVAVGGIYFRRRVLGALELFGVSRRARRVVGWIIPWLLYGYPALVFVSVVIGVALGSETVRLSVTGPAEWLLVYPFWMAVLIMLQSVPFLLAFDAAFVAGHQRLGVARARRWRALASAAVIAVFAVYTPARIIIERDDLDVHRYQVGEGEPAERLRIAFLADLQLDPHTDRARAREVTDLVNRERPDLVLVGGDWINSGPHHIDEAAAAGAELQSRLGTSSVRGDHEHFAYRDRERSVREVEAALARRGIDLVHNRVRWIDHQGARVAIIYLSYNYIYRTPPDQIRDLLDQAAGADFSILLTHQFDSDLGELVRDRIDLALIAHTHGGQVNPVVGLVHVPIARVETPYVSGRYQLGSTTLIVTPGIGFSIAPFRYASPASVEIIDVYPNPR